MSFKGFDPFKVFVVDHKPCTILQVKVVRGHNITKGWAKDWLDTPDPYLTLLITTSPSGWQKTSIKDNEVNPVWNETFTFFLDPSVENQLDITLMDANYVMDEELSSRQLPLKPLPVNKKICHRIKFNETSEVDIELSATVDDNPQLRYSLALCDEEKCFVQTRKQKMFASMKEILKESGPRTMREVPTIGVLGSGGGFRAMTALCGVMTALVDSKILDMVTYIAGLSGSAWYISQLYSHPDWPAQSPGELREELKRNIENSPFRLLGPQSMYRYITRIIEKRKQGQPVSFTDLFGHLVGETILKGRMECKLSGQHIKLQDGSIPMPIYTCLHVKKHVSAMIFHEWMEFSPFEIGMPKYGTFMKPEIFGSKFFMGQIVKRHPEPYLHFLQGIWGSAFCIQFKHLLKDDKKVDMAELMRREREELVNELQKDLENQSSEESDTTESDTGTDSEDSSGKPTTTTSMTPLRRHHSHKPKPLLRKPSTKMEQRKPSFWSTMLEKVFDSHSLLQTIEGRAAVVHNFMRGLSLSNCYPFCPFQDTKPDDQFDGIFEMYPTNIKKLYVVDGGLTFNSPYPPMLRPQRSVDLLLSFDFSARPSDTTPPFKELLLAEKWARLNKVPFPPIDASVINREGLKECYVFQDPRDPHCPIVMHFCLVNITFRQEKYPGVKRETEEEKEFADFDIFDDPERPYSTFNFKYTNRAFERLSSLMEFNTLMHKDLILKKIKECIRVRRRHSVRRPFKMKDINRISQKIKHKEDEQRLAEYLRSLDVEEQSQECEIESHRL